MNVVERAVRTGDQDQQRLRPLAFAVGVFRKFGDDRGGSLCAFLAFYGFLSLFPLLLLLVTIFGLLGGGEHSLVQRVEHSAFSQFPIVGTKLSTSIHGLHDRSVLALVLRLMGFLYVAGELTVYAAEINVVRARHLWPRGVVQPPLTAADKEVLSSIALEGKRRPEQYVAAGFHNGADGAQQQSPSHN